jgi:transcriptional regulator with XRE-family HTH domain
VSDTDIFEDEEEETPAASDNKDAIIQRLQKKAEKLEAKVEKAREEAFTSARASFDREQAALKMASELDLKPGLITRFLKENPEAEPTADAFKAYAEELGVPVKTTESQTETTEEKTPPAAASFHQGSGTPAGAEVYTPGQVFEMAKSDPGIWDRLRPDQIKQE